MTANEALWLKQSGRYRYYCSISYPGQGTELLGLALKIQSQLGIELGRDLPRLYQPNRMDENAFVFTSKTHLWPGLNWENELAQALCHSLTMIVLAVPAYALDDHQYCGREFKCMHQLSMARLGTEEAIFPIILSEKPMPVEITRLQGYDLSQQRKLVRLSSTSAFRQCILEASDHIHRIGRLVMENRASASKCEGARLPMTSAFPEVPLPELPNRKAQI